MGEIIHIQSPTTTMVTTNQLKEMELNWTLPSKLNKQNMQHDFIFNTNKMMIALFYIKNCNQISSNDVDYDCK